MKTSIAAALVLFVSFSAYAQWDDGMVLDVQEVDIAKMRAWKMPGAEALMKIVEQYVDGQYRFAFVSYNYLLPQEQKKHLVMEKNRFTVVVTGYPSLNSLVYAQVFFDHSFFFIVLAKKETDLIRSNDVQIIKMNYEKGNTVRRNNVRDTIQRNNIIPLGIDTMER